MRESTKERIVAVVRLVIPCAASVAALWGIEVDADALVQACLTGIAAISWVVAWWKDNNLTDGAIELHGKDGED